jgi:2-octaprenyl-6-methoxyphenol hydroxylase
MSSSDPIFDVVIAGGGMVGASLACALEQLPLRVAVIEPYPFDSAAQPSFDLRTTALSRSSQRILSGLGVWNDVADAAAPIRSIHVSEQGRFGTAVIDAREQRIESLGYVLENRRLGRALWQRMGAADRLSLLSPAQAEGVQAGQDAIHLEVIDGDDRRELRARLLVVADGARSRLRDALGIRARQRPYHQTAIVGTVQFGDRGDGDTAYERFTPDGPMAILPAGTDRHVFVLTRHSDRAGAIIDLPDADFTDLLQRTFGYRLGRVLRIGKRAAYPLSLTASEQLTAPRAVIIGNAAHGLHPVAGQGYNLGLRDAASLAECLADALRDGPADAGDAAVLRRFADWRRSDQEKVVAFTDGLVRLFDLQQPGLGLARGLGLAAFDVLPGAKRALARQTMGLGGRLTRLARGLPL